MTIPTVFGINPMMVCLFRSSGKGTRIRSGRNLGKISECVLGIEPNEHRIPRFLGKYSYHTDHSENPERPNSLCVDSADW